MLDETWVTFFVRFCEVLAFTSTFVLMAALTLGILKYRHLGPAFQYFVVYLTMLLCSELIGKYFTYVLQQNNLILLYPYLVLEFFLVSFIYRELLQLKKRKRLIFNIYVWVITAGLGAYTLFLFSGEEAFTTTHFQWNPKALINGSILVYAILYLIHTLRHASVRNKITKTFLLINNGVLLYFSGSLIVFLSMNYLVNVSISISIFFFLSNAFLALIFYLFCLFAIWNYQTKQTR